MINVIVVFPKLEEAKSIKGLLVRNGINVMAACTTAAQVINLTDDLEYAVVVSGYKFVDMMYDELKKSIPASFEMLVVVSQRYYSECSENGVNCLSMPIKAAELVGAVNELCDRLYEKRKRARAKPKVRSPEEQELIARAKLVLMEQKGMTEDEAHRYLLKKSMDNGTNLVETAQMVLVLQN